MVVLNLGVRKSTDQLAVFVVKMQADPDGLFNACVRKSTTQLVLAHDATGV